MRTLNVLAISPLNIASYWVGIHQPFSYLQKRKVCQLQAFSLQSVTQQALQQADIVIFVRQVEPDAYRLLKWANQNGKRTVYLIDDHFLALPQTNEFNRQYVQQYGAYYSRFLRESHHVVVGAPYFQSYVQTNFNWRVVCIPASIDFERISLMTKPNRNQNERIIGYEGSKKEEDFAAVIPAIRRIMDEYKERVRFEFFGFLPADLQGHRQVSYIEPLKDYRMFLRRFYQCSWDIGLAPLHNTPFNRYKTNNKFREYSACWIPGIYSNLQPYSDWVEHGKTGYIVYHTPDDWYAGMKRMLDNESLRKNIRAAAGAFVRERFSIEACANQWRTFILQC